MVFNDPTEAVIGSFYAGSYTFSGGPGNDVGAFTTQITVPVAPTFISPAPGSNGVVVDRKVGMNVTWNAGGATGPMPLVLSTNVGTPTDQVDLIYTAANCTVLPGAGSFTIPAYALLALPGSGGFLTFGPGDLRSLASGVFSASGLNLGIAQVTYPLLSVANPVIRLQ